jgi:hypothetical protein
MLLLNSLSIPTQIPLQLNQIFFLKFQNSLAFLQLVLVVLNILLEFFFDIRELAQLRVYLFELEVYLLLVEPELVLLLFEGAPILLKSLDLNQEVILLLPEILQLHRHGLLPLRNDTETTIPPLPRLIKSAFYSM